MQTLEQLMENRKCIAVIGGGGKTSLLFTMAKYFCRKGRKVIVTTTTHMGRSDCCPGVYDGNLSLIEAHLTRQGCVLVGNCPDGNPKMSYPGDEVFSRLYEMADVLLVEADGARMLPLKVPAAHEPVIPSQADLVIGVAGLDALDQPIYQICHRCELASRLLGKFTDILVTEEDIAKIAVSEAGMRKNVGDRAFAVILNKADTNTLRQRGEKIREMIQHKRGEVPVYMTTLRRQHTAVILLAAGASRRFGRENKLLHQINGKPMIAHIMEKVQQLGCGSVTVVLPWDAADGENRNLQKNDINTEKSDIYAESDNRNMGKGAENSVDIIEKIANSYRIRIVYNPHPEEGMASSIRVGVGSTSHAGSWLLCVCDQPNLTVDTLDGVLNKYFDSGKGISVASYGGKTGNPAVFSHKYYEELMQLQGDIGGRHIITNHRDDTVIYKAAAEEFLDIDRASDLEHLRHHS